MTLLPAEMGRITIPSQEGWMYEGLPERCQVAGCGERGEWGCHHVVRRSATAGAKRWISIDGQVVLNEVKLCHVHHVAVTDHHAWIVFSHGWWLWYEEEKKVDDRAGLFMVHPKSGRVFRRISRLLEAHYDPDVGEVVLRG